MKGGDPISRPPAGFPAAFLFSGPVLLQEVVDGPGLPFIVAGDDVSQARASPGAQPSVEAPRVAHRSTLQQKRSITHFSAKIYLTIYVFLRNYGARRYGEVRNKTRLTRPRDPGSQKKKYRLTVDLDLADAERYAAFVAERGAKMGTYARKLILDDIARAPA